MIHNKKNHGFFICHTGKVFVGTMLYVFLFAIIVSASTDSQQDVSLPSLTSAEKFWVDKHNVWRIGVDSDFSPFESFNDQGEHIGIGADYLRIVAEKLGVELIFNNKQTWSQVISGVKNKQVDVLAVAAKTPERMAYLAFSKPYLKFPTVVVCRTDEDAFNSLADFNGRKVALVKDYAMTELTLKNFPAIVPVFVDTVWEGLSLVTTNQADAFVGDLATITYKINEFIMNNLRVTAILQMRIPGFSMAVRKDWSPLAGIIDKVLDSVTREENQQIRNHWLQQSKPDTPISMEVKDSSPVKLQTGLIATLFFAILLLFILLLKDERKEAIPGRSSFMSQSARGQAMVIYFNIILIVLVATLSWWALGSIKNKLLLDWQKSMVTARDSVQQTVSAWAKTHFLQLRYISADPELVRLVEDQLAIYKESGELFTSQLEVLREIFTRLQQDYNHIGFFIIAPDGTNLGSLRDSNMGAVNLIGIHRPDLLARAFAGETVLIPPIPSDVPLGNIEEEHGNPPPTMFFATPVKNSNGKVIAVLTERFKPHGEFSNLFTLGRLGDTGESYAFDREGRLLSASRFHKETRGNGSIKRHDRCILSITIHDPTSESAGLTRMAKSAINGESSVDTRGYNDYRGVPVFGAWTWDEDLGFGIACEVDVDEAMQSYYQTRMALLFTLLVVLVVITTFLWLHRRTTYRLGLALDRNNQKLETVVADRTKELLKSKKEQDLIFATMSEALFVHDKEGHITFINQAAVELLGYEKHELLGSNINDMLYRSGDDGSLVQAENCIVYSESEDTISDEGILLHKDGHTIPIGYSSRLIDPNDRNQGMVMVCHDISDRLASHKDLEKREAQLRLILDSAPIAVGISNSEGELVFGNRRLFEQIRIKQGEKTEGIFVDPAQRLVLTEKLDCEGIVRNAEVKLYAPDNNALDTLATYIRSEYKGKPAIIAWFYDISIQKQAELRLDQARQLAEDANLVKSEFLANMSHELRTPLNAIIGMSRLALEDGLSEKQHHYIDSVYQSGEILLALINDILDFSRIEAGRMELDEKAFAIADVFVHLERLLSFEAKEKGLKLALTAVADIPSIVIGDKFRLNQILTNLLSNAIKFTDEGQVEVGVSIKSQEENTITLLYHVKDSGIGMTPAQQEQLFQPFIQADSSVARKYGGSGLGLVISKHLVELMGGSIWLQSTIGVGTTFSFTVNLQCADNVLLLHDKSSEKQEKEETQQAIAKLKGAKVLLAEDNDFNRILATELLTSNGLQVLSATNGLEVLDLLKQQHFSGILMDCQMPEMDGYAATSEIRKLSQYRDLPILAMTANAMEDDRKRSFAAGMNGHICKPIDPHEMFTTMAKWFVT